MKKRIILLTSVVCMIAVIVMAFVKKNEMFKKENKSNKTGVNKSTLQTTKDQDIKKMEDIPLYNMGEKAHCGSMLPEKDGGFGVYTFDYEVEDYEISDKVDNVPDNLTDDDLRFIDSEGHPQPEFGDEYKFVNIKLKLTNNCESDITTYINCMKLVDGEKMKYIGTDMMVCYSDFERYLRKDYYGITIPGEGEFETVVSIAVKESVIPDNLLLIINPNGIDNIFNGAVMIKLR